MAGFGDALAMSNLDEKVVSFHDHRRSVVARGITALAKGEPAADVLAAFEHLVTSRDEYTDFLHSLTDSPGAVEIESQDCLRLYDLCARASAVVPRRWPPASRLDRLNGFEREYVRRRDGYNCFTPAWEIGDFLQRTFADDDPALIIGRHMAMLFDRERLLDPELCAYLQDGEGLYAPDLIGAMLGWVARSGGVSTDASQVCKLIAERECTGESLPPEVALPVVIEALTVPQGLFVTLANWIVGRDLVNLDCRTGSLGALRQGLSDLLVWMLMSCTAVPSDKQAARNAEDDLRNFIKRTVESTKVRSAEEQDEVSTLFGTAVTALLARVRDKMAERVAAGTLAPAFPPQLLPHLVAAGDVYDAMSSGRLPRTALPEHLRQTQHYRQRRLGGYAPFELEESFLFADLLWDEWSDHDVAIQLSQLWMSGRDPSGEMTKLPAWFGSAAHDSPAAMTDRAVAYRSLYRAAMDDGLEELAVAVASFFVFSQGLRYGGRLGEWAVVGPWLHEAVRRPGAGGVEKAVSSAILIAEERGDGVAAARLESLLANAKQQRGHVAPTSVVNPIMGASAPSQVLNLLEARFSRERLSRLSPDTLRFWTNAHAKEAAHRGQQLFGLVEEWGSVAEDLCKPFEAELVARLGPVYRSNWYREFKKARREPYSSTTPTLGQILFLLHDYRALPPELRADVDEVIDFERAGPLRKQLEQLASEHRNAGAHSKSYSIEKLNDLMKLLYARESGLWERFLDALRPVIERSSR